MKKRHIKSIVHDLLHLEEWHHPLDLFHLNKYEIDLITGENNWDEEDSMSEMLKIKRKWFLLRIATLRGALNCFGSARIVVDGSVEKVEIIYNGEKFKDEIFYEKD